MKNSNEGLTEYFFLGGGEVGRGHNSVKYLSSRDTVVVSSEFEKFLILEK
jgi:hypothetical protein